MNTSLKCRYDVDKNVAAAVIGFSVGDLKIRASLTDATIVNGPSLNGLALAVEKPGSFIVDYYVPKQNFQFQFMSKVNVFSKPLNLTYIHSRGENRTILNGTLAFNQANKVSANYAMGLGNCKLKYIYIHKGKTTFEPSYDVAKSAWDFAISRKVYDDDNDVIKAIYNPSSKALALEWSMSSKANNSFKITASINMDDEVKKPKLIAETTLEF